MYRYYYTFEDDGIPEEDGAYCVDAESAILCGKELDAGGFWISQYAADNEEATLSQCTFVGKIYIKD